jgi:hypothetical protein
LISHADWSKSPGKRWIAIAVLQANHRWLVCELSKVREPSSLFLHLKSYQFTPSCIMAGFDFPIGVPISYAAKAGITDFLTTLALLGHNEWDQFYTPAELPTQISINRPFYPNRPGNSRRHYLEQGLNIPFDQLYRLCEVAHENRRAACPLFWSLGGQQVGKAAISGWQSLLSPALDDPELNLKIWPFSGSLADICKIGNIVVLETYPAEFYGHLGISFSFPARRSKRNQIDRKALAHQLISWAADHNVELDGKIIGLVMDGFGNDLNGEDRFDAFVGLYGMINVILGNHLTGEPTPPLITKIEGWIFGQEQPLKETRDSRINK